MLAQVRFGKIWLFLVWVICLQVMYAVMSYTAILTCRLCSQTRLVRECKDNQTPHEWCCFADFLTINSPVCSTRCFLDLTHWKLLLKPKQWATNTYNIWYGLWSWSHLRWDYLLKYIELNLDSNGCGDFIMRNVLEVLSNISVGKWTNCMI